MPSGRKISAFVAVVVALARSVGAQDNALPIYNVWWTAGWHAPVANAAPLAKSRMLMMTGIERRFTFARGHYGAVSFSPALLPAVNATSNRQFVRTSCATSQATHAATGVEIIAIDDGCYKALPYSAFGVGMLPLAFRWQTVGDRRLGLIADIDGGGVWFSHRVPVTDGTYFNFAARGGIDATYRVAPRTWLSAGYRHIHLSNGGTGAVNPGIDAPLIAFGLAWR